VLLMTFEVKNPLFAREFVTPSVTITFMQCAGAGHRGSTTDGASQMWLENPTTTGAFYADNYSTALQISPAFKTDIVSDVGAVPRKSGPQRLEARPMQIREADFFTGYDPDSRVSGGYFSSSTDAPCALNEITITLHSYVPLFANCQTAESLEPTRIIIAGLDVFQTWDNHSCSADQYEVTTPQGILALTDKQDQSISFTLTETLRADEAIVVVIKRYNHMHGAPATSRLGVVSVRASNVMASASQFYNQLRITRLWWLDRAIGHTSSNSQGGVSYPCDDSTIRVTLQVRTSVKTYSLEAVSFGLQSQGSPCPDFSVPLSFSRFHLLSLSFSHSLVILFFFLSSSLSPSRLLLSFCSSFSLFSS